MNDAVGFDGLSPDDERPVFIISVAAALTGMHTQTLRAYDRLDLVRPARTHGGGRRYSARDVTVLREVHRLSRDEGVSLAGIYRILDLENQRQGLAALVSELRAELGALRAGAGSGSRVFMTDAAGVAVATERGRGAARTRALVLWRPQR